MKAKENHFKLDPEDMDMAKTPEFWAGMLIDHKHAWDIAEVIVDAIEHHASTTNQAKISEEEGEKIKQEAREFATQFTKDNYDQNYEWRSLYSGYVKGWLSTLSPESEWISVEDEPIPRDIDVWAYQHETVYKSKFISSLGDGAMKQVTEHISHWMPYKAPSPPIKGEKPVCTKPDCDCLKRAEEKEEGGVKSYPCLKAGAIKKWEIDNSEF